MFCFLFLLLYKRFALKMVLKNINYFKKFFQINYNSVIDSHINYLRKIEIFCNMVSCIKYTQMKGG